VIRIAQVFFVLLGSLASLGMTEERLQAQTVAPPAALRNAKLSTRAVAPGGLSGEVSRAAASAGPVWIGYLQPLVAGKHRMCCFGEFKGRISDANLCCGGCALERDSSFTIGDDHRRSVQLEGSPGLVVLLRAERGRVGKVRALDDQCALDAGGLPFFWLTNVRPEESVALLASIARQLEGDGRDEDTAGSALAAIALTAHPSADEALERLISRGESRELRKKAAFWIGNSRGRRGFEILKANLADPDSDFRNDLTFALSQSPVAEAVAVLIGMAKRDPEGEVRGQALFWLAQKAADEAAETIQNAIRDDPDEEVKKRAVFALSQLRGDQGVTELIRVARTNRNPEVRKQAVFWLGQSRDPRALAFIEEILDR
jgi:HEAT repeat protein